MLYSPARCYGNPDELREFIDTAHSKGFYVLLDAVYNHFGPDGNYTVRPFIVTLPKIKNRVVTVLTISPKNIILHGVQHLTLISPLEKTSQVQVGGISGVYRSKIILYRIHECITS